MMAPNLGCTNGPPRQQGPKMKSTGSTSSPRSPSFSPPLGLGGALPEHPYSAAWCRRRPPGTPLLRRSPSRAGCPVTAMSRGARTNYDVMGLMPEEVDHYSRDLIPVRYSFPAGSPRGTGRVGILNDRLLLWYGEIGKLNNRMVDAEKQRSRCNPNTVVDWMSMSSMYSDFYEVARARRDQACHVARTLIVEIEALGHKSYIPPALLNLVTKPDVVPFGSMAYLCNAPHYFSPEEYPVPDGLPVGDDSIKLVERIRTVGDANCFLSKKYGVLMRQLNRARFYRDWRLHQGASATSRIDYNDWTSEIISIRSQFEKMVGLIKKWKGSPQASELFMMPDAVRDFVLSDNGVMGLYPPCDLSPLYPRGHHQLGCEELEIYLFLETASGYTLFQVLDGKAALASTDWESFRMGVRLTVYYPFPSASDALNQFTAITQGIMTEKLKTFLELYLPCPNGWKQFRLGVQDKKFGKVIQRETGIHCRSKSKFVRELLRGCRLHFHSFTGVEESSLEKSQLHLAYSYIDVVQQNEDEDIIQSE